MKATLLKYKIGLGVLFAFALVLVGVVMVQASSTKQDTKTNNAAQAIADKLNTYTSDNDTVPATLADAGAKNVPSTISYTKLSDTSYKFCATYKGDSSGFDATGVATDLMTGSSSTDSTPNLPADKSELMIDSTYHKGANCQTVQMFRILANSNPCVGLNNASCANSPDTVQPQSPASNSSVTLCDYATTTTTGCQMRCVKVTQTTAARYIDGTVTAVTGSGSSTVLTVKDTKNALHTVTFGPNTQVNDSSCSAQDASIISTDDQVRVAVDAAVVYPGGVNDKVMATEVDDFSY